MSIEDFCMFLDQFQFFVVTCLKGVAVFLLGKRASEWASVFLVLLLGTNVGNLPIRKVQSASRRRKKFDITLGYPGEDICVQSSATSRQSISLLLIQY